MAVGALAVPTAARIREGAMNRSRAAKVVGVLAASLAMAFFAVVSSSSHETELEQEALAPDGPGPDPAKAVAVPRGLLALEISLGLGQGQPASWEGDIGVSQGSVVSIDVVRGGANAQVEGSHFAVKAAAGKAAAKNKGAAKKKKKQQAKKKPAKQQAKKKQQAAGSVVLRATLDAPATARVTVRTGEGEFAFAPAELAPGTRQRFLDGHAAVERQFAAVRLTGGRVEDDFPASAKGPDGTIWLANVEYHPERPFLAASKKAARAKNKDRSKDTFDVEDGFDSLVPRNHGDRIRLRRFNGKEWLPAISVTEGGLDVWRPTVAVDGQGVVWVAWAQQVEGDWEIFKRGYTPPRGEGGEGTWTEVIRVTNARGTDFHVVATTDARGVVWLAWQGRRQDQYDIWVSAQQQGHAWSEPRPISNSPANDWSPAIAADPRGNVHVAWDSYDQGNYDVRLRTIGQADSPVVVIAGSSRFEGRPSLACDRDGRLWIAYEEGDEQWGKDYAHAGSVTNVGLAKNPGFALYVNRTVRVKCLADNRLHVTAGALEQAFAGHNERNKSLPRLAVDGEGGVWLTFRHHPGQGGGEVWVGSVTRYDGKAWSAPRVLASSANLIDNRPALAAVDGGILAVYSTDSRLNTQSRKQDDLYTAFLPREGAAATAPNLVADAAAPPPAELATVHPNEAADIARVRAYRVNAGGKSLRLARGEFHRHTEFSSHNDQDGLLEDAWRYGQDAADHDWMGDGDHDNGFGHEYMWWLIQKVADIHHNPPRFVAAQTYERSVVYPNGHRNVMMPRRGIRPLPRGELLGTAEEGTPDTKLLYAYLKHFGGICASHTSATNMGTDWRDNDPLVEPVVEIFQGHRHNYEAPGAPRSPTEETQIGGFQPAGFIWNALGKGYRLGFQSSSDHVSTHMSYAIVLTEDLSRQAIIDAFKARHCYAATDNIILEVRSGDHLMGDTFETADRPTLQIVAHGTAPVARVDVVRDNTYVFSTEPNQRDVSLSYTDDNAEPGKAHYYYARIQQADGNLAWASPMWITQKK
jgi:hypothetical protein